jgi:hypothetical protein
MPVLGQVAGSMTGAPTEFLRIEPSGFLTSATVEPWHCQQPLTAARRPSTTSPRMLSSDPMNLAASA